MSKTLVGNITGPKGDKGDPGDIGEISDAEVSGLLADDGTDTNAAAVELVAGQIPNQETPIGAALSATYATKDEVLGGFGSDVAQIDRVGVATSTRLADAARVEWEDAAEITFDFSDLDGWTNSNGAVDDNKLFAGSAPGVSYYPFPVAADEVAIVQCVMHLEDYSGNHGMFMGFCVGGSGSAYNTHSLMMGARNTSGKAAFWHGASIGGGTATDIPAWTAIGGPQLASGDYLVTVSADLDSVSLSLVSLDDTSIRTEGRVDRSVIAGNVTHLVFYNGDNRGMSGSWFEPGFAKKAVAQSLSKTAGAISIRRGPFAHYTRSTSDSSDRFRVELPNVDPRIPIPMVLRLHERTGDSQGVVTRDGVLDVAADLVAAGFGVVTANAGGEAWANDAALGAYVEAVAWARGLRAFLPGVHLWGDSMGALTAANLIVRRTLPNILSFQAVGGAFNLRWAFDNNSTYKSGIKTAYSFSDDGDFETATDGHDMVGNLDPSLLRGVPMRLVTSADDTSIPRANHTDAFAELAEDYCPVTVVTGTGGHLDPAQFVGADFITFMQANGG